MSRSSRIRWFLLGAVSTVGVVVALVSVLLLIHPGSKRPPAPPAGAAVGLPWGAIDVDEAFNAGDSPLERSIADSIRMESATEFDLDRDGVREYAVLVLSAGGSYGAFGAGVLCGWTEAGTRPNFKIVTGVSTGALQANFAFLGPEYDEELKGIYTKYFGADIHTRRFWLAALVDDATHDTAPLKRVIDSYVTDEMLAAVAERHARGGRLFVGTTNMDTGEFVMWDLGAIASSGRPDSKEQYSRVLLASCSVPVVFPPVYFPVQANGQIYYEMHADGGVKSEVFFRGFMLDLDDALEDAGLTRSDIEFELYVIKNGPSYESSARRNVRPRAVSIGAAAIEDLVNVSARTSLYRIYTLAGRYGIDFNLAILPTDYELETDALTFSEAAMKRMFEYGYEQARGGYQWLKHPPGLDPDEILKDQ